jgi:hypothetical protein
MIGMPAGGRGGLPVFVRAQDRIVSVNLMLVTSVEHAAPSEPSAA